MMSTWSLARYALISEGNVRCMPAGGVLLSVCSLRRRSRALCLSNRKVRRLARHQDQLTDEFRDSRVREIVVIPNERFVDLDDEIGIAARGCIAALERRPRKLDDFPGASFSHC